MLDKYKLPMPDQNLSDEEVREFIAYFKWADANLQVKQQTQTAVAGTTLPPKQPLSGSPGATKAAPSPTSAAPVINIPEVAAKAKDKG